MPKVGLEPTWAFAHYALNVARLPIPPLRLALGCYGPNFILNPYFVNLLIEIWYFVRTNLTVL